MSTANRYIYERCTQCGAYHTYSPEMCQKLLKVGKQAAPISTGQSAIEMYRRALEYIANSENMPSAHLAQVAREALDKGTKS